MTIDGLAAVRYYVIKWKHFPCYWPLARRIHRSPVNSPHKGQWLGALMCFFLRLNKRLSKQWWGWWFETPSRPLWRYCNEHPIFFLNIEYFWYNFWSTTNVNPSYSSTDVNDSYKMFEAWPPLPPFYKISHIFACTLYDSNNDVHVTIQTYS